MTILALPNASGTAWLDFERTGQHTTLVRSFAASPLKVFSTQGGRSACWVYSATLGGGLVGGDEIRMNLKVGAGARAFITTQASTKVYRSLRPARQIVASTVEAGGLLVVMPDPIVCFRDADFVQRQHFELSAEASLVLVDWMTSGRHATGERWAFSRYDSRTTIARERATVFHDSFVLERDVESIADRMRRFDVLVTAVITGPLVSGAVGDILRASAETAVSNKPDLIFSASALGDGGVLLRMAGVRLEQVGAALRNFLRFLSPLLGDDPWSRKG